MKPQNPQEPIIKHDTDLGWELFVPQHLLPVELRVVSVSPAGLYIETTTDAWDLIPFQDLADLMGIGSRTLDEQIDIDPIDHTRRDRKSTRLNSSHVKRSRMPSSA